VQSPTACDAMLSLGSDDGIKVWLNGKLVHRNLVCRGSAPGQDTAPVKLAKGRNRVLVKVEQQLGGFNFYLAVLDHGHKPLSDLTWVVP